MFCTSWNAQRRNPEAGMTLVYVGLALVFLLGVSALAIDLASLYVAKNEAQRAADAAALAGAKAIVDSGYTSGLVSSTVAQTFATPRAIAVAAQNAVAGQAVVVLPADLSFDFSRPENPRITVTASRTDLPTFFAKAIGVSSGAVRAAATAEAYNPSGSTTGGPTICVGCLKPIVLPNCDPNNAGPVPNPFCPGSAMFVSPLCQFNPSYPGICNPGPASSGGVIGLTMVIRPGNPSAAPAPSQYYSLAIGGTGANVYRNNWEACNPTPFTCGDTLNLETGDMRGPTKQGVGNLIGQPGQDTIDTTSGPAFPMTGGSSNPIPALRGQPIFTSRSIITAPLYDGSPLCPGGSCGSSVKIVGYLQLFITSVSGGADVSAVILNVSACGIPQPGACGAGGGGGGTVSGGGASLIPVRLIR